MTPAPWLTLWAQAQVVSKHFEGPDVGRRGGFHRIDAGGAWRILGRTGILEKLELTARIENLTDEQYEDVFGFPALGFNALVGLRGQFQ